MKLQISFDITDLEKALSIARDVAPFCDTLEIGTVLIYKHGIHAVQEFRKNFPDKAIMVDSKIVDRGKKAATLLSQAGASWITVLASTSNNVIHAVCTAAGDKGVNVMLDLLGSASSGQSALEAQNLGVDALLFHEAHDAQDPLLLLDQWEMVRGNTKLPIYVSAQINRENVDKIIKIKPDGIVIGTSIVTANNPKEEAQFFYELLNK